MTVHNDDVLGLYTPEIATYGDLSLMIETSTIEENPHGSVLAASLLQLPDVFTRSTAASILDSVSFHIHSEERELQDGGGWKPVREILAERFQRLADIDKDEKSLAPVETGTLEQVLSFAQEDPEAARNFYQGISEIRREEQRQLSPVEKIRLLLEELKQNSSDVTVGQFMLVEDPETATVAARSFPAAEKLLSALNEADELTPAEQRRADRIARAKREQAVGAGNRILAESTDLEIMILLDEDPETLASLALNTTGMDRSQLLDVLENASDRMIANWVLGLEHQQPQRGEIEDLVSRFTEDRVRELAGQCQKLLASMEEEGGSPAPVPWIVDIINHVYVPRMYLDTATAALVWHQLFEQCADDPAMWLAVLLADTSETSTRLQDII